MISEAVIQALRKFVPEENICLQESMASHTTFRIGGLADCFVQLENTEQLIKVQKYLSQVGVPFFILGNGSNLLVSDAGFRGVILQIGPKMSKVTVEGNVIVAQAGASMAQIARTAMEHELAGMEFASGIPGTIGGGVVGKYRRGSRISLMWIWRQKSCFWAGRRTDEICNCDRNERRRKKYCSEDA